MSRRVRQNLTRKFHLAFLYIGDLNLAEDECHLKSIQIPSYVGKRKSFYEHTERTAI